MTVATASYPIENSLNAKRSVVDTVSQTSSIVREVLGQRRSVKQFDAEVKISDIDLQDIIKAASSAPSAFNIQHWRVVQIKDRDIKQQLHTLAWKQPQILTASELLVICMDVRAWDKEELPFCHAPNQEAKDKFKSMLTNIYANNYQLQRDEAQRSASLFSMSLMLQAQAKGYQTCPMSGFDYYKVGKLLKLPPNIEICMLVALGKESEGSEKTRKTRVAADHFVKINTF